MGCSQSSAAANEEKQQEQSSTLPYGTPRSDEDFQNYLQETQARIDAENAKKENEDDEINKEYWA